MAPNVPSKYEAIIADPEIDTRMRLKQATASVHNFGKVAQVGDLDEALNKLQGDDKNDVVFISYKFDQADVTSFIKQAKASKQGQDTAYILVMKTKDQSASVVAQNVMIGADGFLFEPYSVDYLIEITNLAAKVRKERTDARERGAMKFLVTDVMNQIDMISTMKQAGYEVGPHLKKLREMCGVFATLTPESHKVYMDVALQLFENAPLPKKLLQKKLYTGASDRIKKRMEKKLVAAVEASKEKPTT